METETLDYIIDDLDIAIVGMAGRFPGAATLEDFWRNLRDGVESISWLTDEELIAAGVAPDTFNHPHYVKAASRLEKIEWFDATFFGISPREAEIMDPQHRLFLECAWEALEGAGYVPQGAIGVYAGANMNSYLINLYSNQDLIAALGEQITFGNSKDFLPTRISYKFNLKGPSLNIQTACSTSLVAVHVACQSLLNYECDMALAGGVSIKMPQNQGYPYRADDIFSPDGHCRTFDAKAQGTIFGSGIGIVVLKRLKEAMADRDPIHAVIKGSAINNDGSLKVSYTAPSVEGQAEVIVEALSASGVSPDTISYVEAHGTGTALGDPIEIQALTKAFRTGTTNTGFCAIGSVKSNVGHLVSASGIAGLIKTVLALKHRQIPPSLHFEQPNPQIDFTNSPFYVNTKLTDWHSTTPRWAGVSSFGMGGTNAHIILQEAPPMAPSQPSLRPWQLLLLSAKTESALDTATKNLAICLQHHSELNLADVAYTLHVGRKSFDYRRMVVCRDRLDAVQVLSTPYPQRVLTQYHSDRQPGQKAIAFLFPGQGAQYVNMGRELYDTEPTFRQQVDQCCQLLKPELGFDLRDILYPNNDLPSTLLSETRYAQPALFVVEYALARLWMSWGVQPKALIGHSLGEYVAATLAGVFSLEDALTLIAIRGKLMQQLPAGAMLSVQGTIAEVQPLLNQDVAIASHNSPSHCVISGKPSAIDQLQRTLTQQGFHCRQLEVSHAFHSPLVESILIPFADALQTVPLKAPQLPFISNVSGTWMTDADATDPHYWVRHLRQTVRFSDGIRELLRQPTHILLEVGPGQTLSTFVRQHSVGESVVFASLRHPQEAQSDSAMLLHTVGQLWLSGVAINWTEFHAHEQRWRSPLPTYPFERQRYWIERTSSLTQDSAQPALTQKANIADWFYLPIWKQSVLPKVQPQPSPTSSSPILMFVDEWGLGTPLANRLQQEGYPVTIAQLGNTFARINDRTYTLDPAQSDHYDQLIRDLVAGDRLPHSIIHCWAVDAPEQPDLNPEAIDRSQTNGFYSLLFLAQALGKHSFDHALDITVISSYMQRVIGSDSLCPEKATSLGCVRVMEQEYPNFNCRTIDITMPEPGSQSFQALIDALVAELQAQSSDRFIAYRGSQRWIQTFEPFPLTEIQAVPPLKEQGVYLITGGLGGIGLAFAEYLATTVQARLVLIGRSAFPDKANWSQWLLTHESQDEISQKIRLLQQLEASGADCLVIRADVTHPVQMQEAIAQSLAHFGTIHGVIHAAGTPGGGLIQGKTRDVTERILSPKVNGTVILSNVCRDLPLDFFVLCSSLNAIIGGVGQVDYCAANAFLDAFAYYKSDQDGTLTLSINWDTWKEVGMAARLNGRSRALSPASVLSGRAIDHPLLDTCISEDLNQAIYVTQLTVQNHWVLSEHRIQGTAVLVGTAYLEMARAAVADYCHFEGAIALQNVYFLSPLRVNDTENKQVQLQLQRRGTEIDFVVKSQSGVDPTQWQDHAKGTAVCLTDAPSAAHSISAIADQCSQQTLIVSHQSDASEPRLAEFGPRWTNLKQINAGPHQALATLELPERFADDLNAYTLHPALLDLATGFMRRLYGGVYLPFSYKQLTVQRSLPRRIYSHIRALASQDAYTETLTFNVQILDEQGNELVTVDEFTMRKVKGERLGDAIPSSASSNGVVPSLEHEAPQDAIAQRGMTSQEGIEVFRRVLQGVAPQVLISTRDLPTVIAKKRSAHWSQPPSAHDVKPTYARPPIATAYVAPQTGIEQTIADIWQTYLGITAIGIHDHFFELGGDSLLATQVISAMRQAFQVDLPLHSVFETPTVAQQSHHVQQLQAQAQFEAPVTPIQKRDRTPSDPSLLVKIDQLSEQELDTLLNELLAKEVNS
ncbi:SDR family NAD(P)-dependent oxidoreductase [Oculatella sp. LEGE 06141]|uniref:type I polyketide synthase n=1 Tax=Oculatella sp. LEGE 06141 TaxID=1828648 RepID=UPI00187F0FE4|nr:type I polyketide synthase [Oculatella sp. LEGE 06141]MBE9178533.1 SDR family NAD(P)-dependent oxidoreductase [Oculatella sp. LEGE 06141]